MLFKLPSLDYALGKPQGDIISIVGPPDTAKTSLCTSAVTKDTLIVSGSDVEARAKEKDLNCKIAVGRTGESLLELIYNNIDNFSLIIVDPVTMLLPEGVRRLQIGEMNPGHLDRFLAYGMQELRNRMATGESKTNIILTDTTTQEKGRFVKTKAFTWEITEFMTDTYIFVDLESSTSKRSMIRVDIRNNKARAGGVSVELMLKNGELSKAYSLLRFGLLHRAITKEGAWYIIKRMGRWGGAKPIETTIAQGLDNTVQKIERNYTSYFKQVVEFINKLKERS